MLVFALMKRGCLSELIYARMKVKDSNRNRGASSQRKRLHDLFMHPVWLVRVPREELDGRQCTP